MNVARRIGRKDNAMKSSPLHIVSMNRSAFTASVGFSRQGWAALAAQPLTPPIARRPSRVFAHARETIMLSTIALLIPLAGALADQWTRVSTGAAPAAATTTWAAALAADRANFDKLAAQPRTAGLPAPHYIAPKLAWSRIATKAGPVVVSTLSSKCEEPNSATALDVSICEYVISSESGAFALIRMNGCFTDSDKTSGTDFRYDAARNAIELRVLYKGQPLPDCAQSFSLSH